MIRCYTTLLVRRLGFNVCLEMLHHALHVCIIQWTECMELDTVQQWYKNRKAVLGENFTLLYLEDRVILLVHPIRYHSLQVFTFNWVFLKSGPYTWLVDEVFYNLKWHSHSVCDWKISWNFLDLKTRNPEESCKDLNNFGRTTNSMVIWFDNNIGVNIAFTVLCTTGKHKIRIGWNSEFNFLCVHH